jgi:hypothetical protein
MAKTSCKPPRITQPYPALMTVMADLTQCLPKVPPKKISQKNLLGVPARDTRPGNSVNPQNTETLHTTIANTINTPSMLLSNEIFTFHQPPTISHTEKNL